MSVALHLVYCTLQGEPVPSVLPPSLIHPTKRELVQFSSSIPPVPLSRKIPTILKQIYVNIFIVGIHEEL